MELTIPAAIAGAAGKFGDGPALAEPGGPRVSYHQLHQQTTTVTRALIAEGVSPGDRVAILCGTRVEWILEILAELPGLNSARHQQDRSGRERRVDNEPDKCVEQKEPVVLQQDE